MWWEVHKVALSAVDIFAWRCLVMHSLAVHSDA
jgi:hypothetical protein